MPAVLTLASPLRKDKNYSQIVVIIKFSNKFSITEQGLSRPKIIQVEASDGCIYKELVKGGDDMRQDAVMEQVFEHVNQTLHKVEETKKRKLGITCMYYLILYSFIDYF
jgi:ataxia telangiectasia mutated family protein